MFEARLGYISPRKVGISKLDLKASGIRLFPGFAGSSGSITPQWRLGELRSPVAYHTSEKCQCRFGSVMTLRVLLLSVHALDFYSQLQPILSKKTFRLPFGGLDLVDPISILEPLTASYQLGKYTHNP